MESFIKKNSYAILLTLFEDDPYWIENVDINEFWTEFKKTLDTLPTINRLAFVFVLIMFSIILPPYSFFSCLHKSRLSVRKKWLNSWAQSKWLWKKSAFVGIRILILSSAFQLPQTMAHTNYQECLSARKNQVCLEVNNTNYE